MESDFDKKIEQLLLYLRSTDPAVRFKALHKLNQVLAIQGLESFRHVILQNISKYSLRDPNPKIKEDAQNILFIHQGFSEIGHGGKFKFKFKSFLFVVVFIFIMLLGVFLILPGRQEKPVVEDQGVKIVKEVKQYDLKLMPNIKFTDDVKVEIRNEVVFKGNSLFTNVTNFKINRSIKKIFPSGEFIMQKKITEGFGIMNDLHPFGYPNPGENLLVTYSSLGEVKSISVKNKQISDKHRSVFSKFILPKEKLAVGDTWDQENNIGFKFNNVVFAKKQKFIQLLYHSQSPILSLKNRIVANDSQGEIFLDFKTRLPVYSKFTSSFKNSSQTTSVSMNTITTITESSSKLDSLKLELYLSENMKDGNVKTNDSQKINMGVVE